MICVFFSFFHGGLKGLEIMSSELFQLSRELFYVCFASTKERKKKVTCRVFVTNKSNSSDELITNKHSRHFTRVANKTRLTYCSTTYGKEGAATHKSTSRRTDTRRKQTHWIWKRKSAWVCDDVLVECSEYLYSLWWIWANDPRGNGSLKALYLLVLASCSLKKECFCFGIRRARKPSFKGDEEVTFVG